MRWFLIKGCAPKKCTDFAVFIAKRGFSRIEPVPQEKLSARKIEKQVHCIGAHPFRDKPSGYCNHEGVDIGVGAPEESIHSAFCVRGTGYKQGCGSGCLDIKILYKKKS